MLKSYILLWEDVLVLKGNYCYWNFLPFSDCSYLCFSFGCLDVAQDLHKAQPSHWHG